MSIEKDVEKFLKKHKRLTAGDRIEFYPNGVFRVNLLSEYLEIEGTYVEDGWEFYPTILIIDFVGRELKLNEDLLWWGVVRPLHCTVLSLGNGEVPRGFESVVQKKGGKSNVRNV